MDTHPSASETGEKGRRLGDAQGDGTRSVLWLVLPAGAFLAYRALEFVGVPQARSGTLAITVLLFFAWKARSRRAKILLCLALPSAYLLTFVFFEFAGVPETESGTLAFACVFLPLVAHERRSNQKGRPADGHVPDGYGHRRRRYRRDD